MTVIQQRLRPVPRPPTSVSLLVAVVTILLFSVTFPFGPDIVVDIVIEGLYLVLSVGILLLIRRLDSGLLDVGMQLFVLGRLVDFLDEIFLEPEPLVEPYISGFFMLISLSVVLGAMYQLLGERDDRIDELESLTEELSLKNEAIEEAPIGITIADMQQDDEPLLSVNDTFEQTTGYDASEAVGRNCRFLQGEDTDPERVAQMREAIDEDEEIQVTLRNYRKDGTRFWNEITLAPVTTSDTEQATHYAGFQQDVTVRKEYERQLREQRDNLDVLNQMLQHDIRNDLQLVTVSADLLSQHVSGEEVEYLETIEGAATDAIALTETARDLAEAIRDAEPETKRRSVKAILEDEVDDLRSAFDDVTVEVDGPLPNGFVEADAMLDSVFRNVLRNAVQHNDKDHPEVEISARTTGKDIVVRIADNGPGIPDERKSEIFGRGEKGLKSDGTGIGTYLVATLLERYGGEVQIEDNDPTGSVFVLELPLAKS